MVAIGPETMAILGFVAACAGAPESHAKKSNNEITKRALVIVNTSEFSEREHRGVGYGVVHISYSCRVSAG